MLFHRSNRALSNLELLVAIALISVLSLLGIIASGSFRERAAGNRCVSNLRQIGVATMLYAGEHHGAFPFYPYEPAPNQTGSGAVPGTWFYNLAPYLSVPRTEVATPSVASVERTRLGTAQARIASPCVFTCPAHRKTESNSSWQPEPMTFPSLAPVSYAPSSALSASTINQQRGVLHPSGETLYPIRLNDIVNPSQKIWLCDSPTSNILNVSAVRWLPGEPTYNFPRQGFTRHQKGGNALFFDGHVEWLPLSLFTTPDGQAIARYFNPRTQP